MNRNPFDTKSFQLEHPELYQKFIREGNPRLKFSVIPNHGMNHEE